MKKYFVTIKITQKCWDYKVGQLITSVVFARSEHFAESKFENEHWGSEYPSYNIISITKEDDFLFNGELR